MFSPVRPLCRRGRILPGREVAYRSPLSGDLRVEECYDEDLRRHVRVDRLLDPSTPGHAKLPPARLDDRLLGMSSSALGLASLEWIEGTDYAQSWLIEREHGSRRG